MRTCCKHLLDTFATVSQLILTKFWDVNKTRQWSTCFDFALVWLHARNTSATHAHETLLQQNLRGRMQHFCHCSSQACSKQQVNISVASHIPETTSCDSFLDFSESMLSFSRCRLSHHPPKLAPVKKRISIYIDKRVISCMIMRAFGQLLENVSWLIQRWVHHSLPTAHQ